MKPLSAFTTPRKLICPISRHFLPVEQPEPVGCCTTGLKKGSRFPFIAHFFSSGFGAFGASMPVPGFSSAAILSEAGAAGFAAATFAAAAGADAAGFLAANASAGFAAGAATGAAALLAAGAGLLFANGAAATGAAAGFAATV